MDSNIVLKIQNGTTSGSVNLCRTCRQAHVVRGTNNQQFVTCTAGANPVRLDFEVAECNRYFNATQPTLYEMEEIAWRLVTKKAGRDIGFVNAGDFRRMSEDEERGGRPGQPSSR